MNGREERDIVTERKIQELISGKPAFIAEYYVWIEGRASLTKLRYINYLLDFLHFYECSEGIVIAGWKDFQAIDSANLSRYFNYISYTRDSQGQPIKKCQASIVGTKLSAMKTFFDHPQFGGMKNPIELLGRRPKIRLKEDITVLDKAEIQKIWKNIDRKDGRYRNYEQWRLRDKLLFLLPLSFGIRISALQWINVEDIDIKNKTLSVVEKENKYRIFQISDDVLKILTQWLKIRKSICAEFGETNALFICVYGGKTKRISDKGINKIIERHTWNIDKHITAHKLRSSFATNLYNEIGDIYVVSELLGHESPETTKRYAKISEKRKVDALEKISSFNLIDIK